MSIVYFLRTCSDSCRVPSFIIFNLTMICYNNYITKIKEALYILYALRGAECDKATLRRALERTTQKRGSGMILTDYPEIMKEIRGSDTLRRLWEKYSREYEYAKDISFDDTCNTMQTIMDAITV